MSLLAGSAVDLSGKLFSRSHAKEVIQKLASWKIGTTIVLKGITRMGKTSVEIDITSFKAPDQYAAMMWACLECGSPPTLHERKPRKRRA